MDQISEPSENARYGRVVQFGEEPEHWRWVRDGYIVKLKQPDGLLVDAVIGRDQAMRVVADHYELRGTILGYDIELVGDGPQPNDGSSGITV